MFDFLTHLFDTQGFPPRWHCGDWSPAHGWLHVISDLAVWSAYFAIPCILLYFVLRRRDIPFRMVFCLFGAFILACGTTHLMEAIIFWWPAYRLAGVIKLFTALVSWGTVLALIPATPKALAMRSPEQLEREIVARQGAEQALQQTNDELQRQVAALRASEERFRLLVEGTRDHAIFMLDPAGRVASWNLGAERLLQYRADEIIGRHCSCFFPPEDAGAGRAEEELRQATAEGKFEEENWRVRQDGTRFWASVVVAALRDEQGQPRGFAKIIRDATIRKQAEENARQLAEEAAARRAAEENAQAIERQREQLRVTLRSIGDGVITTDAAGRVTLLNPVAESLMGRPGAEAVGQPIDAVFRIIHEQSRAQVVNPVVQVLATGQAAGLSNHALLVARDGSERPIDDSAAPIRDQDGRVAGAVLVFRDITERRREEGERQQQVRQLAEAEERIRAVVENVIDAIITIDERGQVQSANPAAERLFGYKREELLGQNVKLLMPEPYHGEHDGYLANYLRTGQAKIIRIGREVEGRRKDGSTFPMELAVSEFALGGQRFFTGIVRDITERKQAEAALREADRRKDEFLATLAHELRNPLAPIVNSLQILRMAEGDLAAGRQARAMMERQLQHLVRLVDDLLDVSRITRGKVELRRERIELSAVLQNALEASRSFVQAKAQSLTVHLPTEPLWLDADPTRLAQIVSNLLNNAAKYTDRGGQVWLTARRDGHEAVISIRDDGVGIAAEHLAYIFGIFSQVVPALERSQGGLGVGLALVRGLVELHGGTVEARSAGPGQGSEFVVRLPAAEAPAPATPPPAVASESNDGSTRRRILVVDDNRDAAASLAMFLQLIGHDVQIAHDGPEALEMAGAFAPEVVLLDIGMPRMNGYDAARHIRAQPWGQSMFLVALTGWGQESDKQQAREAGFDLHLTKPVEPEALEKVLAELTHASRAPS
ncbi:MAG: PAS domain S-box protein [Planctomycetia bacterium]|nr:PAS domain S-box protein [Planctomycetia bacterium]